MDLDCRECLHLKCNRRVVYVKKFLLDSVIFFFDFLAKAVVYFSVLFELVGQNAYVLVWL